jgi:hypothetical protein
MQTTAPEKIEPIAAAMSTVATAGSGEVSRVRRTVIYGGMRLAELRNFVEALLKLRGASRPQG